MFRVQTFALFFSIKILIIRRTNEPENSSGPLVNASLSFSDLRPGCKTFHSASVPAVNLSRRAKICRHPVRNAPMLFCINTRKAKALAWYIKYNISRYHFLPERKITLRHSESFGGRGSRFGSGIWSSSAENGERLYVCLCVQFIKRKLAARVATNPSRKAGHNSPRLLCAAQLSAPNFNGLRFARRLIHRRIAVCFRVNYGKTRNKFRSFFFFALPPEIQTCCRASGWSGTQFALHNCFRLGCLPLCVFCVCARRRCESGAALG